MAFFFVFFFTALDVLVNTLVPKQDEIDDVEETKTKCIDCNG